MKLASVVVVFASASLWQATLSADAPSAITYPEGYRTWSHVKSTVISPTHKSFADSGGFQHIYANTEAMAGYRTREFTEGSVIVFEWLDMRDTDGAFVEGPRRRVDVMVKDSQRFATTGGWTPTSRRIASSVTSGSRRTASSSAAIATERRARQPAAQRTVLQLARLRNSRRVRGP
jgi:hypothetical protein